MLGDTVNYVNSSVTAKSRGIKVTEEKENSAIEYTNILSFSVRSDKETMEAWGTVYSGNKGKIVKFNDYFLEVDPEGTMIIISNEDKPGVIGKIGTIMGAHHINIASMKVSRKSANNKALIILNVDEFILAEVENQLKSVPEILKFKVVTL